MKKLALLLLFVLTFGMISTINVKAATLDQALQNADIAVASASKAIGEIEAIEDKEMEEVVETEEEEEFDENKDTFKISPSSKPYKNKYVKNKYYNSNTKGYFLLESYMEILEKQHGGTLVLKAGTYTISNAVKIPSHVTIILEDGVTLKKATKGAKGFKPACGMFQIVPPSVANGNKKLSDYNGAHDVSIIGKGDATIDMKAFKGSIGIVMGHAKDIKISGIKFVNMNKVGHFIELNSSKNVKVTDCVFNAGTSSKSGIKECINIDAADKKTHGFDVKWSSHDKTCCDTVLIEDCTFKNSRGGIGTHNYSVKDGKQKYHKDITVRNCDFYNCGTKSTKKFGMAIRMLNWKDADINNNTFDSCKKYTVYGAGVIDCKIKKNYFKSAAGTKPIYIARSGNSKHYKKTYSSYDKKDITDNKASGTSTACYLK
ncbi:MAG: hypothetical protein MJ087_03055 [Lachnospiraceae bacterium]|nr:hypothetical protein [Lachnospiraceae bacterium]